MPVTAPSTPTEVNLGNFPNPPAGYLLAVWQATDPYPDPNYPEKFVRDTSCYVPNLGFVDARTTTAETIRDASLGKLVTLDNAGAVAVTLDSAHVPAGFMCFVSNQGAGAATLTPSSGTIDGLPDIVLAQYQGGVVFWDGTNWKTGTNFVAVVGGNPYDAICSLPGKPGGGSLVFLMTFTRPVSFPGNFAASQGTVGTNPTSSFTYTVYKNGSAVGTVVVSTGGAVSFTTSGGAAVSFAIGDRMTVTAQATADPTLSDVAITFAGVR